MDELNGIFNEYLVILVTGLAAVLVGFIVNLAKIGSKYLTEKISTIQNEELKQFCIDMMQAAETMTKELLSGEEKKIWVTEKLIEFAKAKKIPVTEEQISNLIQAIFQELDGITLNKYKYHEPVDIEEIVERTVNAILEENVE